MALEIERLRLINFKNYEDVTFSFNKKVAAILGPNGAGKTNLLDAIHYLSQTRSFLQFQDQLNIRYGQPFFTIKADVNRAGKQHQLTFKLPKGDKKQFEVDHNPLERLSDHIGWMPAVLITPDDIALVNDTNDIRRKWTDMVISHVDHDYLHLLIRYQQALKQRNALLKHFQTRHIFDASQLEPFDKIMIPAAQKIGERRHQFFEDIVPRLKRFHARFTHEAEIPRLEYNTTSRQPDFEQNFIQSRKRDAESGRSNIGIHKDEVVFLFNDLELRKYGSQGQRKSYVIALKLAQYDLFSEKLGIKPLLLMDDIFDKLDEQRIESLVAMISSTDYGQLFITDARPDRTRAYFSDRDIDTVEIIIGQNAPPDIHSGTSP